MGASTRRRSVRHKHPLENEPGDVAEVSRHQWKNVADANARPMCAGRTIEIACRAGYRVYLFDGPHYVSDALVAQIVSHQAVLPDAATSPTMPTPQSRIDE